MIVHAPLDYYAAKDRVDGYRAALEGAGIAYDPALVKVGDFTEESGYDAMNALLEADRPDAVFAGNDTIAYGAIQAIYDRKLSIPQDVSIAGFDDDFPSKFMNPALTTMSLPATSLGATAASMLIDLIRGEDIPPLRTEMNATLSVRDSCVRRK